MSAASVPLTRSGPPLPTRVAATAGAEQASAKTRTRVRTRKTHGGRRGLGLCARRSGSGSSFESRISSASASWGADPSQCVTGARTKVRHAMQEPESEQRPEDGGLGEDHREGQPGYDLDEQKAIEDLEREEPEED